MSASFFLLLSFICCFIVGNAVSTKVTIDKERFLRIDGKRVQDPYSIN